MKDKAIQEKKLILFVNLEHLLNIWFCFMGRMCYKPSEFFLQKKKAILAIAIMSTCITSIFDSATLSDDSTGDSGRGSCRFGGNNFTSLSRFRLRIRPEVLAGSTFRR